MKRGLERRLIMSGAVWNLFTALLTLFGYYGWFNDQVNLALEGQSVEIQVVSTSLAGNVSRVILAFGLFMFVMAIINFLVGVHLKDGEIQKNITRWLIVWIVIQLISMDIIGFLLYLFAFIFYKAKNKAVYLAQNQRIIKDLNR